MDDTARLGLRAKAKAIEEFMKLEASEKEWIFPLLNQGVPSSIELLELIASRKTVNV